MKYRIRKTVAAFLTGGLLAVAGVSVLHNARAGDQPPDKSKTMGLVIDEHALEQLVAYVKERGWSSPFVVMDANTEEAAGSGVAGELSRANLRVTTFCFPERSGLLADETSVSRLHEALKDSGTDSIVAVGSGVITDTTRYVASLMGREFVSVPTAASMDGYA